MRPKDWATSYDRPRYASLTYLLHALEQCPRVVIPACILQTAYIPLRLPPKRQESLRFGGQKQPLAPMPIRLHSPKQWLDPVAISHRNEQLSPLIVYYTRKLSSQVIREIEPMVQVQCDDDLGVAVTDELVVCLLLEPCTDGLVVIELAVDYCVDAVGGAVEGLSALGAKIVDA